MGGWKKHATVGPAGMKAQRQEKMRAGGIHFMKYEK
jgi:hypothetical protein